MCGVKLDAGAAFKALYYVPHLLALAFRKVFLMPFSFFIRLWWSDTVFLSTVRIWALSPRFFVSAFLCQEDKGQVRVTGVSAGGSEEGLLPLTPVADSLLCL